MKIRYLYILFFIFIAQYGKSQQSYSEEELGQFVQVYMEYKTEKVNSVDIDQKYFDNYNISISRYKEIAQATVSNQNLDLSSNEIHFLEAIKQQKATLNNQNKLILNQLCIKNELPQSTYASILNQYQRDIHFQRSLQPFFATYIKERK